MERILGVIVYLVGLIMMLTMILEVIGIINQVENEIATILFLVFGYILCITGFIFSRRTTTY